MVDWELLKRLAAGPCLLQQHLRHHASPSPLTAGALQDPQCGQQYGHQYVKQYGRQRDQHQAPLRGTMLIDGCGGRMFCCVDDVLTNGSSSSSSSSSCSSVGHQAAAITLDSPCSDTRYTTYRRSVEA